MANGKTIKKVAGYSGLGLVLATTIVMSIGKDIAAWPGNVGRRLNAVVKDTDTNTKDIKEQKEINKAVDVKLDKLVAAQNAMNVEQAKQGVTLKNIGETLKRMEADQ